MRILASVSLTQKHNAIAQKLFPSVKIFFIGFNKTATMSMHVLMKRHGIESVHWRECDAVDGPYMTVEIEKRLADLDALKGYMGRWTAFSDFHYVSPDAWVEGNRHFRIFDQAFPRSFFVLNDRDTDDWITSRLRHGNGMLLRYASEYFRAGKYILADWARLEKGLRTELEEFSRGRVRRIVGTLRPKRPAVIGLGIRLADRPPGPVHLEPRLRFRPTSRRACVDRA